MTFSKAFTRSVLTGLTVATSLTLAAPAALAQQQPPKHKTCIVNMLGIKICFKGLT